jgi:AcrR family transcriptional regulator
MDSRSALLDAAAEEFAKDGLRGTRVQAIVKRAGVNERMIYHHFGSKEGLYAAVIEAERMGLGAAWWPYLEKGAAMEPYEGMRAALSGFFEVVQRRPRLIALLMHDWLSGRRSVSIPTVEQLPAPMRELYERGQRTGVFRLDRPFEVAYGTTVGALVGLSIFVPRFAEIFAPDFGSGPLREEVVSQLLDGLTGPGPGPARTAD